MSEKTKIDKMEWQDWGLIILFFIVSVLIFIGIKVQSDAIMGYIMPIIVMIITTAIFVNYLIHVRVVFRDAGKTQDEEQQKE